MGQFKPMVKMMTTEPTVELKLKKGGTVKGHKNMKSGGCMKKGGKAEGHGHKPMHMMDGGISAALAGEPMIAPKRRRIAPMPMVGKPSLAARRAAMAGAKAGARAGAKQGALASMMGGMKTGGVAKGQGGYKTGGVAKGQGGYKSGGIIKSTTGVTKVVSATADHSPAKTGDVKLGNGGGYKKGGSPKKMAVGGLNAPTGLRGKVEPKILTSKPKMELSRATGTGLTGLTASGDNKSQQIQAINALRTSPRVTTPANRPMKKGGSTKKFAEGGSVQDDGRPQKMAQGAKKPSSAVSIDKLSGTFKKGGTVASKKLQAVFKKENAPAMKAAKADSNLKYSKYQKMQKFADGGTVDATGRPVGFSGGLPMPDNTLTGGMPARPSSRPAYNPEGTITAMDYSNSLPGMSERPFVDPAKKFHMPTRGAPFAGVLPTRDNRNRLSFNPPPFGGVRPIPPRPKEIGTGGMTRQYKKGGKVKGYAGGGMSDYEQSMSPEEQLKEMRMRKAMDRGYGQVSERETASNEALLDSISSLPKAVKDMVRKAMRSSGAVTDTEKTVSRTVVPAKKRGGKVRK